LDPLQTVSRGDIHHPLHQLFGDAIETAAMQDDLSPDKSGAAAVFDFLRRAAWRLVADPSVRRDFLNGTRLHSGQSISNDVPARYATLAPHHPSKN
jgi:hypothetical protein